jgi:probable rRNA maturation factor
MINFYSETKFKLKNPEGVNSWLSGIISEESKEEGDISYIFCADSYLHKLNLDYLKHDTLTDILSFDYSLGEQINGEIYISVERVKENAMSFVSTFEDELHRVMIHGILHYCGYKDKDESDILMMRQKEEWALAKRTFL